jgi:hypothetical protein
MPWPAVPTKIVPCIAHSPDGFQVPTIAAKSDE